MSRSVVVRSPWWRESVAVECSVGLTEQAHRDACDINSIVRRYARTGILPPALHPPQYEDVTLLQAPLGERIAFSEGVVARYEQWSADQAASRASPEPSGAVSAPTPVPTPSPV